MKAIASLSLRQPPLLPRVGWTLYIASMVVPSSDLKEIGAEWFVSGPVYGISFLFSGTVTGFLVGVSLLAGVAANASLFVRVPVWTRIAAIVVPWSTYATFLVLGRPVDLEKAFSIPYFFPWAVGIALVNIAQIREEKAKSGV
jgi:hypothetical protein